MTRVGLVHLTPEQLELLSAMVERPDFEVIGAVHADANSTPFKIAQVFAIPTDTQVESLRSRSPDLVVVPEEPEAIRREVLALGLAPEVLTTREAAERYGLAIEPAPPPPAAGPPPARSRLSDARAAVAGNAAARPQPAWPNLEFMLRDGLDDLLASTEDLGARLRTLAENWASLLGSEACAVLIEDPGRLGHVGWIAGGPRAELAPTPDALARAVLDGVPKVYLRHDSPNAGLNAGSEEPPGRPRRALAAFPLEAVKGALWFLDLRLPAEELDERLMVLRRTARRLGRLLALEGRVAGLDRDRAAAVRMADLAARMAVASERQEVTDNFRQAVLAELQPDLVVFRLPGSDPDVTNGLGPTPSGELEGLLALEEELARAARSRLHTQQQPPTEVGHRIAAGLAVPIRHGKLTLGTVSVFRTRPGSHDEPWEEPWSDEECQLLERLSLHAGAALALVSTGEAELTAADGVLDLDRLLALLRAEVRRSDRYSVPFLLTVFELEPSPGGAELSEELTAAFLHRFLPRLRGTDAIARLGPTRFAVLNPHTDRGGGRVTMRAREVLGDLEGEFAGASEIQVRANQVHFPADVSTLDELLSRLG